MKTTGSDCVAVKAPSAARDAITAHDPVVVEERTLPTSVQPAVWAPSVKVIGAVPAPPRAVIITVAVLVSLTGIAVMLFEIVRGFCGIGVKLITK